MKDKNVAAILALFMGSLGVHKFYLGRIGVGILYLVFSFTFIPALLGLVDFFVLALMDRDEFDRRYNGAYMLPSPVVVNMLPPAGSYGYGAPPPPGYGYGPVPYGSPYGPPQASPAPAAPAPTRDVEHLKVELEKLNELRISGLLTEDEFAQQKMRLLGG